MSYVTVAAMHQAGSLLARCGAAVAAEVAAGTPGPSDAAVVDAWTVRRSWDLASTPGWSEAWESAVAGGVPDPGADPGVITDGMVLSRVQQLLAIHPLDEAP